MIVEPTSEPSRTRGGRLPAESNTRQSNPAPLSFGQNTGLPANLAYNTQSLACNQGASDPTELASQSYGMTKRKAPQEDKPASPERAAKSGLKRKYICSHAACGKSFTTSGHLARHFRIHTGEKAYACPLPGCPSRFSRQDNMIQHYRTHLGHGQATLGDIDATRPATGRSRASAAATASSAATSAAPPANSRMWTSMAGPSSQNAMQPPNGGQPPRLSVPVTGPNGQYGTVGFRSTALPAGAYGYAPGAPTAPGSNTYSPFAPSPLPLQPGNSIYSQQIAPQNEHQSFDGALNNPLTMQTPMYPFTPVERRDHPGQTQMYPQHFAGRYTPQTNDAAARPTNANANGLGGFKNTFPVNEPASDAAKPEPEPSAVITKSPVSVGGTAKSPEKATSPTSKDSKDSKEDSKGDEERDSKDKESLEHSRSNSGLDSLAEAVASYA